MKKYNTHLAEIIYEPFISDMINELNSFHEKEIEITWDSLGGSVWTGNKFADFLISTDKKITARVTGVAASMGATLLAYFDKVVGSKQADIMLHSALSSVTELTKRANQSLYDALKAKINEEKFKEITGYELKDVMFKEGKERIDVWFSGEDAFNFGLFDELIDITPEEKNRKNLIFNEYKLSAGIDYKLPEKFQTVKTINKESMKKEDLKLSNPEIFNEVFEDGIKRGVSTEQERVKAWMVFNDLEPEKVKLGIESGKEMTKSEELSFLRKSQTLEMQKALENSNPEPVIPNKEAGKIKTDEEKEALKLDASLGKFIKEKEVK